MGRERERARKRVGRNEIMHAFNHGDNGSLRIYPALASGVPSSGHGGDGQHL